MMQKQQVLGIFYWVVFGNYWVSAGLVALYAVSCNAFEMAFSWVWAAALFFAAVSVYTYHRVGPGTALQPDSIIGSRRNWIVANRKALQIQMLVSAAIAVGLFSIQCAWNQWLFLFPLAAIALVYILPFIPYKRSRLRLRELPFAKIFIIAGVWIVLSILPLVSDLIPLTANRSLQLLLLQRLLFLFAIAIPFDVRDMEIDRHRGVKTLATALGAEKSIQMSQILLGLSALVCWMAYQSQVWSGPLSLAMAVSAASTALMLARIKSDSEEMTFSFWLEGSMLDQLFWVQMFI